MGRLVVASIENTVGKKLVNGSLPDIDADFAGKDRAEIKNYMESRFGDKQVASVGTFSTFRPKGVIKDLARIFSLDFSEANLVTSILGLMDTSFEDVIRLAVVEPKLKAYIKKNSDIFYMMPTLLDQVKTESIHACALIVFPEVMTASEWAPMRSQNGSLVTQWGGGEMDDAGFLKDDILGIKQLDKFSDILDMIRDSGKDVPDIYSIPKDDEEVYEYFSNGWNGDVFQFGSAGLVGYTKQLKPDNIDDLIAAVALYRPGAMENGYHNAYVESKNHGRAPKYLWGTEEITKGTFGNLIYQEQIMEVFQKIGGLTMNEADDVRRALGKKKIDVLRTWKERVLSGYLERGATEEQFEESWAAMEEFAKYSFNLSHSAAYGITGYVSQWLKVHYPIEYWTVALNYADEERTLTFLAEILQSGKISISSPDVNQSKENMISNQSTSTIYWGIAQIKGIGEDTAIQIVEERTKNGDYLDMQNFIERHTFTGSKVKKTTYEALISSGAFDIVEEIEGEPSKRMGLIDRYRELKKVKIANPEKDIYGSQNIYEDWWWKLQQKTVSQLSFISYGNIIDEEEEDYHPVCSWVEFNREQKSELYRSFGGYVTDIKYGKTAKGKYARITLENNYNIFKLLVWPEEFKRLEGEIKGSEKNLIIFEGILKYDDKYGKANQFTVSRGGKLKSLKLK